MSGPQHLIDFVLNEVALCGDQGATLSDILQKIDEFHSLPQDADSPKQNVDDRFKAKVWSWLAKNPEVSVGRDKEWNHLTLDQAVNFSTDVTGDDESETPKSESPIRVFVSKERTWLAVAGHPPDDSKVVPLEFVLLSIIAAHKSKGIAQPDLVKLSGQDKRSVPKRTDALQKKGYIDKRPIQTRSARTSLCTLNRFLHTSAKPQEDDQPAGDEAQPITLVDFDSFNNNLFNILREHQIIGRDDLKRKLGFKDRWRWKVLSRAVRKWERIGVLKRVRAQSQYDRLHPCVKLEREPTATDLELFHEFDFDVLSKHGVEKAGAAIPVDADHEDLDPAIKTSPTPEEDPAKEQAPARRIVACWTPDRTLNNQLFDLINGAGTEGITNMKLMRVCFGKFFKRPAENLVHRLVDFWQIAQPLHLRHFAVVRDMAMAKTVMFYVHYSADNFAILVDEGRAAWEAVEFPAKKAKSLKINLPPYGARPNLDDFGFPANVFPRGLLKNPYSTLRDGMAAVKPADYTLSSSDPFIAELPNGQCVVRRRQDKRPVATKQLQTGSSIARPRGRPSHEETAKRARELESKEPKEQSPEENLTGAYGLEEVEDLPPPKRAKKKIRDMTGMTKKEKFEALGMDINWTEYNALLMEKPAPGIYVTPHGKKRPAGKARGRPRQSRIAVFKSPKLSSFSWFVRDESDSDNDNGGHGRASRSADQPENTPIADVSTPAKRGQPDIDVKLEGSTKRPRLDLTGNEHELVAKGTPIPENSTEVSTPRHRDTSLGVHFLQDEQATTPSKRRRTGLSSSPHSVDTAHPSPVGSNNKTRSRAPDLKVQQPTLSRRIPRGLRGRDLTEEEKKLLGAPKPLIERGGSISILRKKVIMEIMDLAGGAYPGGAVIWYPFVTLWMKKGNKEKPDMKTVKNACKQLVDAGQLRQLTFSGRNNKGSMVTKTLLLKLDMSPDHPRVKEMQKKFLAMDSHEPRPGFCENVEIDNLLTRSSGRPHGEPPRRQKFAFPVERGVHFNLHHKPASVANQETRKTKSVHKKFLRRLEIEARIAAQLAAVEEEELSLPGVKRLMTLSRPPNLDTQATPQTSIMRPYASVPFREPRKLRNPIIRANRMMKPISSIGSYAMLMKPPQHFHLASGTFSTGSCSLKSKRTRFAPPIVNVKASINELNMLAHDREDDPQMSFSSRTEKILRWELNHEDVFERDLQGQQYIDQTVQDDFETAPIHGSIRFVSDRSSKKRPGPQPGAQHHVGKRSEMRMLESGADSTDVLEEDSKRKTKERRARPMGDRRLAKLADETATATAPVTPEKESNSAPRSRFRRSRFVRALPTQLIRNLMIAVIAVRVLAGGAEARVIDWRLLTKAFPDQDSSFIEARARQVLNKNRLQINNMQREFQERFLAAYEKNEVPAIDYEDLESYDWAGIVAWGNKHLEVSPFERVPDLPATPEQFEGLFVLQETPLTANDELFQSLHGVTLNKKRSLMAQNPFAIPLEGPKPKPSPRQEELAMIENAKSWVRANVIAPEKTYRPNEATDILELFGEPLLTKATQSLINDRVISSTNRGRITPGRNYDISENFLQILSRKKGIDSTQIRRAAEFKTNILEPELRQTGASSVKYSAEDGDILALINLYATGGIVLQPQDAPRRKFGLTDGGYLTRQMDKKLLRFAVKIVPTDKYVFGNSITEKAAAVVIPPAPSSAGPGHPSMIPLWYDINGDLEPHLWKMAMAPVLGCLVMRPGIKSPALSRMIKPIMGSWEALKMLQWMEQVGIVKSDGQGEEAGWTLQDTWWMIPT